MIVGAAIVDFHQSWSRVVLIYTVLLLIWALFLYVRGSNPSGSYLGALAIDQAVVVIQGIVGIILVVQGYRPGDGLHIVYGIVAFVTLPAAYFLSKGGTERRDSGIFALATLFLIGISIRAIATGPS